MSTACQLQLASVGVADLGSDAMQAAVARFDNLKLACYELGEEPMQALAIVAPPHIKIPEKLDGVTVYRVNSAEAAATSKSPLVSDFVELEIVEDTLHCHYLRLVDKPQLGGHTNVFWTLSRAKNRSVCMNAKYALTAFQSPASLAPNPAVAKRRSFRGGSRAEKSLQTAKKLLEQQERLLQKAK